MTRTNARLSRILLAALAVLALAVGGFTIPSGSVYAQEDAVPAKPTGLSATATHDQVVLAWDAPQDDNITGYVILRRNRVEQNPGEFTTVRADTGTADTTYTDDGVEPETRYAYRIKAINAHGTSPRSGYVNIETSAAPTPEPTPDPTPEPAPEEAEEPPAKPTGLSATATHDQVVLAWDAPQDDNITGYVILRRNRVEQNPGEFTTVRADTGTADTTYTDDGVEPETRYAYRIKAINAHGTSPRSGYVNIETSAAPTPEPTPDPTPEPAPEEAEEPPAEPTGLSATATHDQVVLAWDDPQDDNITGYVILRRNRVEQNPGEFTTVRADTGTADTTYTDDGVEPETRYAYRIKAINAHGTSPRSGYVNIETSAALTPEPTPDPTPEPAPEEAEEPPAEPTGLSATATHDQVVLAWDDPQDDNITGYVILRRNRDTDAEGEFTDLVEDTATAATTYTDGNVVAETPYTYRIKANNPAGTSERSISVDIDTPAEPTPEPTPPPAPKVSNNAMTYHVEDSQNWISLQWKRPKGDVDGYRVLRMRNSRMEYSFRVVAEIDDPDVTSYQDHDVVEGSDNYWVVQAYNEAGYSDYSQNRCGYLDSVYSEGSLGLAYPDDERASFVKDDEGPGVLVEWSEPTRGYHGGEVSSATGYQILRWDLNHGFPSWDLLVENTDSTGTSFIDRSILPNSEYTYKVRAWNDWGVGERSFSADVRTPDWDVPGAPKNLTVTRVDGGIQLQWNHPDDTDGEDTLYRIYRRENSGGVEPLQLLKAGYVDLKFVDNNVVDGVHYHYQVQVDGGDHLTAHGMLSRLAASGWY